MEQKLLQGAPKWTQNTGTFPKKDYQEQQFFPDWVIPYTLTQLTHEFCTGITTKLQSPLFPTDICRAWTVRQDLCQVVSQALTLKTAL